jgi:hypothetical protein
VGTTGFQTQLLEVKQAKYESDEQRKRLQMGTHTTPSVLFFDDDDVGENENTGK